VTLNLQKAALGVNNTVALTQDTSGVRSQINTLRSGIQHLAQHDERSDEIQRKQPSRRDR